MQIERLRASNGWPKLKAKAAATRHLARFALRIAERYGLGDRQRAVCKLLCRFYQILDTESQFLDEATKAELPTLGRKLTHVYTSLAAAALAEGAKRWKMSPKIHVFDHLCCWQAIELGNPKFYWVYADEDLVGQMIEVSQSCHPLTVAATALFKWVLLAFSK